MYCRLLQYPVQYNGQYGILQTSIPFNTMDSKSIAVQTIVVTSTDDKAWRSSEYCSSVSKGKAWVCSMSVHED